MSVKFKDIKVGDQYALNELGSGATSRPTGTVVRVVSISTDGRRAFRAVRAEDGERLGLLYIDEVDEVDEDLSEPTEGDYEHYQGAEEDVVNHPSHYKSGGLETITVIEAWGLGFLLGNTVKYISRAGKKDDELQDLKKAQWYLNRHIANLEAS